MRRPRVDARNDLVCRDPSTRDLGSRFCQGARVRSGWSFPDARVGRPNSSSVHVRGCVPARSRACRTAVTRALVPADV